MIATDAFNVDGNKVGGLEKKINGDAGKTSTGMWFGPRLGKRREGNIDIPWAIVTVKGKFVSSLVTFSPVFPKYPQILESLP